MSELSNLHTLVGYKTWADDIFYQAVSELPPEELSADRPMLFNSILQLLSHVYSMDGVWRSHLEGVPHKLRSRNPGNTLSFAHLRQAQRESNSWYEKYVSQLSTTEAQKRIAFTFIGGGNGEMDVGEIIQHVVNHGSYHRGHIEGVFYQLSVEPPTTDLSVFLHRA